MAAHEFFFALKLTDESHFDPMLAELAAAVLTHVGFAAGAVEEITGAVSGALADGINTGRRHCDLRFSAHAGELEIAVVYEGGSPWRTSRPLP